MGNFFSNFFQKFTDDETTTLAASLAFYTALSLAPLLILFVTIAAHFSGELQTEFVSQTRAMVGGEAATAVELIIDGAKERPDLTSIASTFGVLTLLMSASLIFRELRGALNRIFGVKTAPPENQSYLKQALCFVKDRIVSIGFVLGFILILICSLLISSVISGSVKPEGKFFVAALNIGISFVFYTVLYTLTFRYLPDRNQAWRKAFRGGVLTALLFVIGKELIAIYLGKSAVGSAYGAAGSIIVLLVWVYYSTLITFVGAQVSSLLSSKKGSHA